MILEEIKSGTNKVKSPNKSLTLNDIEDQKFCLSSDSIFFPLLQNSFLHIQYNKLTFEKLTQLKNSQVRLFKSQIFQIMKPWTDMKLILNNEKFTNILDLSYSLFGCSNKIENCIVCLICNKIVKFNNVKKHKKLCRKIICNFRHLDGRICKKLNHTNNMHMNFFHLDDIKNKTINRNSKKNEQYFNYKEMNATQEIIAYKTNNIESNLIYIVKQFSSDFNVYSKQCLCFLNLKNCQCFRYFLNNIDSESSNRNNYINVYETLKRMKNVKSKSICVIVANKESGLVKHENYSFFSMFRNNNFLKLILLHNFDNFVS